MDIVTESANLVIHAFTFLSFHMRFVGGSFRNVFTMGSTAVARREVLFCLVCFPA